MGLKIFEVISAFRCWEFTLLRVLLWPSIVFTSLHKARDPRRSSSCADCHIPETSEFLPNVPEPSPQTGVEGSQSSVAVFSQVCDYFLWEFEGGPAYRTMKKVSKVSMLWASKIGCPDAVLGTPHGLEHRAGKRALEQGRKEGRLVRYIVFPWLPW